MNNILSVETAKVLLLARKNLKCKCYLLVE